MRHAFLIIAHNNWWQLKNLIQLLDCENHDLYVHIDKRSTDFNEQYFNNLTRFSKLSFFQKYKVYWGGYSQVEVETLLLSEAKKEGYDYYHIISGVDLPLKSNKEIDEFFIKNNGYEFIEYKDNQLKNDPEIARRTRLYHLLQNYRRRFKFKPLNSLFVFLERCLLAIQLVFKVNRVKKLDWEIKYGSNWISITDALVQEILNNTEKIQKVFSLTNCADELFIQTIAFNNGFADKIYRNSNGETDNLRLIDWERGKDGSPYTFTSCDYEMLISSDALFARKFSETTDKKIIIKISENLN